MFRWPTNHYPGFIFLVNGSTVHGKPVDLAPTGATPSLGYSPRMMAPHGPPSFFEDGSSTHPFIGSAPPAIPISALLTAYWAIPWRPNSGLSIVIVEVHAAMSPGEEKFGKHCLHQVTEVYKHSRWRRCGSGKDIDKIYQACPLQDHIKLTLY
jgi:hypothetical protein